MIKGDKSKLDFFKTPPSLCNYHYKKARAKSQGTVVFIHGYQADSLYFEPVALALKEYDYYAFELPNHGYTELEKTQAFSVDSLKESIINTLIELALKDIYLIGHSMGGGLAMLVSASTSYVKALVLITPMNCFGTTDILSFLTKFNPKNEEQARSFFSLLLCDDSLLKSPEGKEMMQNMIELNNTKDFKRLYFSMASPLNLYRLYKASKEITCPSLLILGKEDGCINHKSTAKHLKKHIKNIKIILYEHSGHLPFWEEYESFVRDIKDFLASLENKDF